MSGGRFEAREITQTGIRSGHVTDGGYFDNTGMETAIQLVTALLPGIDSLRAGGITIVPYILFFINSASEELGYGRLIEARKSNRGLGIPLNSFYNPWERGSGTRDALYEGLAPFTKPQVRYLSCKLDYRIDDGKTLRLPLGLSISDTAIRQIQRRADLLFKEKAGDNDFRVLKNLVVRHNGKE